MKHLKTLTGLAILVCSFNLSFGQITETLPQDTSNAVYVQVEQRPTFPGGDVGFSKFLSSSIVYPAQAKTSGVQGRVFASFIIEKDGSLNDINILRDPGSGLGDEAVRVLKLSPKWTPGVQNGKYVRVKYVVPVSFNLGGPLIQSRMVTKYDTTKGKVYSAVEINPVFPGGEAGFSKFLLENIQYPAEAKRNNVTGRVFLQFVVEADGSLSYINIIRDPGSGLGDEAVRVMKLSPRWKPGSQNGKPVRVQFTVPVNFSLSK
ncbi:MAG: energy transducer TonB [Mucilaginibacter sp.]|uniref:energy transducer TonB n=1 Tax=Mucilaginibacter sp. TaxID=1882438 RepID=UPI003267F4BD